MGLVLVSAPAARASPCHARGALPDRRCTPGARNPAVTPATTGRTICVARWTQRVRPPVSVTNPIKVVREVARARGCAAIHPEPLAAARR
jgi:hypothetical protein